MYFPPLGWGYQAPVSQSYLRLGRGQWMSNITAVNLEEIALRVGNKLWVLYWTKLSVMFYSGCSDWLLINIRWNGAYRPPLRNIFGMNAVAVQRAVCTKSNKTLHQNVSKIDWKGISNTVMYFSAICTCLSDAPWGIPPLRFYTRDIENAFVLQKQI